MRHVRSERASVAAEIAVALPALVLVLAAGLAAARHGVAQVRCIDGAREVARLVARGETLDLARAALSEVAGVGASVTVSRDSGLVRAAVRGPAPPLLASWGVPGPSCTAVARDEGRW